ncbi:ubiquitin-like protein Pup [Arcanobacterium pinnipediorum]|uniref:Prokaryotic ubiquitin-like protein Pup n=1 Tax=Arcanobacterium pinnipediorum TaxID=1503041 RepID=A0ABY5AHI6_9ACTO|nr:ubiquitin-like protein Pup [Arcanobacterium pinnipediorum]USR78668.1 ubiquitin-like protein Pup [Arcanobacterium pinnipediorum]
MSEQEFIRATHNAALPTEETVAQPTQTPRDIDALLNDIDAILETNASSFVQGFVQKGGQ